MELRHPQSNPSLPLDNYSQDPNSPSTITRLKAIACEYSLRSSEILRNLPFYSFILIYH